MLAKLSFRNAKRQAHDYIIYFVTLTAIFSLIHGLNSLLFAEDDIFPLDDSTFILPMILISSLLFSISLWLTSYMTNFILKRRSKEISIYITLGMEPYQISKVFTLENFYISIFALILSFLCGSFVYQVLKAVSFNLLGKPYSLTFHFSLYPFVITFLYFLFTFLFSSFRSIKIIQKSQPQDLLQYDSPHKIPSSVLILRAKLLFPASIICITLSAIFFLLQPLSESANFTFGTLFSILFIYLFFHYFPAWIFDWLEKGSWKYHSVRLLVLRAFTARINDMSNSFAFLTSSFTVSLSLIAVVAISIFTFNYRLSLVPFTFSIITSQNQNHLADYDIYIKEKYPNSHSCTYTIYQSTSSAFTSSIPGFTLYNAVIMPYSEFDLCISHSDYSALRSLLGYAPISLNENEYIVHCLLKFDLIKQCTDYAQQQAELKGRNLYFNLTTNLSLMTEEIANYLAAIPHFSIAVSIDGPAECNAARVYANGSETFPDVERGLHLICHAFNRVGKGLTISSVLTPPYDFEKLDRMNKYIEDFPEMPKDSSVVIAYPSAGTYDSDAYVKTINNNPRYWDLGAFDPLAKWQLTQAIRNSLSWDHTNNLYFRTLIESMTRIKNRFASSDPALRTGIIEACCVPAVRKLYVHTDGELSICERIGSSPSVGTISTGVNKEVVLKKYIDDYLAASKPLCENCWAYNICPMCYSECYSQNGVNIKEKSSKCKNCRTYTYLMLGTFCTLMEERPEIMETLNHTVSV